jgi:hypothetical protein
VTFRFDHAALERVLDSIDERFRTTMAQTPDPDLPGVDRLRVEFDWFDEAVLAAFRLGRIAEVLDPPDLRTRLIDLAGGLLDRYGVERSTADAPPALATA